MKDVRDIVRRYLVKNGHDGLCSEDCWCRVDGLMPCDDTTADCQPARAWRCPLCDETVYAPADERRPRCWECGSELEEEDQ